MLCRRGRAASVCLLPRHASNLIDLPVVEFFSCYAALVLTSPYITVMPSPLASLFLCRYVLNNILAYAGACSLYTCLPAYGRLTFLLRCHRVVFIGSWTSVNDTGLLFVVDDYLPPVNWCVLAFAVIFCVS